MLFTSFTFNFIEFISYNVRIVFATATWAFLFGQKKIQALARKIQIQRKIIIKQKISYLFKHRRHKKAHDKLRK